MLEIGSSLREARRHRNVDLEDVERATRIRVQQLQALEQERFELLPPDPYRRSFLREYADFLGLDADLYTSEYDRRFHEPEPRLPSPAPQRRSPPSRRRLLLGAGVVVVAALLGVAAWQLGSSGGNGPAASRTPPATTAQAPTVSSRPHPRSTPTPASAPRLLVLTASRGSCWLLVRVGSADGPIVYQQTLQSGRTLRLGLHRPLWIRLGAPWSVDAAIGRHTVTLPARIGNVLATAAGLRSLP